MGWKSGSMGFMRGRSCHRGYEPVNWRLKDIQMLRFLRRVSIPFGVELQGCGGGPETPLLVRWTTLWGWVQPLGLFMRIYFCKSLKDTFGFITVAVLELFKIVDVI